MSDIVINGILEPEEEISGEMRYARGPKGDDGTTFTPNVDENGNISWTNDGGKENPTTRNIKGPVGPAGPIGPVGPAGPQGDPGGLQRVVLFYDGTHIRLADESQTIQTYQDIISLSSSDVAADVMLLRCQYIIYRPLGLDSKNNIIFGSSYKNTDGRTVVSTIGISSENVVFCEDAYNVGVTTSDQGEIFGVYGGENVNSATAYGAHAEGGKTTASGSTSHAEGWLTEASGNSSHAEGEKTVASATNSHAEGKNTTAFGDNSHAEGKSTTASGPASHAEGDGTKAEGNRSHAEGLNTTASGQASHAEGLNTTASGEASHAEGSHTIAFGTASHAEGHGSAAPGRYSHAEGENTIASGDRSHAEGLNTTAASDYQHVQGKCNIEDSSNIYADIIGNGISSKRSNAATVDWSGNAWYAGNVYVGSTSGTNKDAGSKKLATEEYINTLIITNDEIDSICI